MASVITDRVGSTFQGNTAVFATIAELRASNISTSDQDACQVLSYFDPSDYGDNTAHGGGVFVAMPDATDDDDGFACIVDAGGTRWFRQIGTQQDIAEWGILGDGSVETTAVALMVSHINNTDRTKPYYIERPNIIVPGGFEVGFYGKQVLTRGFASFSCPTKIVGGAAGFVIPKSSSHTLGGMFVVGRTAAAAGRVSFTDLYLSNKSWLYDTGAEPVLQTVRCSAVSLENVWLIDCAGIKHGQGVNKPGGLIMQDVRVISNSALAAPGFHLVAGAGIVVRNTFITDRRFNIFSSADETFVTSDGWTFGGNWTHNPDRFRAECDQASGTSTISGEICPVADLTNGQTYNLEFNIAIIRDGGGSITPRLSNGAGSYITGTAVTGADSGPYSQSLTYTTGHNILEFVVSGDYSIRLRGGEDVDNLVFERPAVATYRSWKMGCESWGANIDSVRFSNLICNPRAPTNVWEWDLSYDDCGNIRLTDSFAEVCTDASFLIHSDNRWPFPITSVTKVNATTLQINLDDSIVEDAVNGDLDYEDVMDEFFVGDVIGLSGLLGMTEANGGEYEVTVVNTTTKYLRVTTPDNSAWGVHTAGSGNVLKATGFLNDATIQTARFTPRTVDAAAQAIKIRNTYNVPMVLLIAESNIYGSKGPFVTIEAGDFTAARHSITFDGNRLMDRTGGEGTNHNIFEVGVDGVTIINNLTVKYALQPGDDLSSSTLQKFFVATENITGVTIANNDMRQCLATEVIDISAITSIAYGGDYLIDNNVGNTYINVMPKRRAKNLGTVSSGTLTASPLDGELQYYTNDGAHTLAVPTIDGDYSFRIMMTMGASAGTVTVSGATYQGNALVYTPGLNFLIAFTKINGVTQVIGSKYL